MSKVAKPHAGSEEGSAAVDAYIASSPPDLRERLQAMREAIRSAAPDAEERISYRMPTWWLGENLVHFAVYERHIGFYPTASGIDAFAAELAGYPSSKGAVQFPHDVPLPLELVRRVTAFRVKEAVERAAAKADAKAAARKASIAHDEVANRAAGRNNDASGRCRFGMACGFRFNGSPPRRRGG